MNLSRDNHASIVGLERNAEEMAFLESGNVDTFRRQRTPSTKYAHHWEYPKELQKVIRNNQHCFETRISRSADLLTSIVLKVLRRHGYERTLFPGVPKAFEKNRELFFTGLGILLQQREFFPIKKKTSDFDYAELHVGPHCIFPVHSDFMKMQGVRARTFDCYPVFDSSRVCPLKAYDVERMELPFPIGSSFSKTPLPTGSVVWHDILLRVFMKGCVEDIVRVEIDLNFAVLGQVPRRVLATNRHDWVVKPVLKVTQGELVNSKGFIEHTIDGFRCPSLIIAFRIFDSKGREVRPYMVAHMALVLDGMVRMRGNGIDFYTNRLDRDPRLDNDVDLDAFGMFVFRFQAPGTEESTDVMPHGALNFRAFEGSVAIQTLIIGSKEGDSFTIEAYSQHVNVFVSRGGLANMRF